MRDRRVVVTGGAGFIGSHVVEALVAQGARVTVLDNLSSGRKEHLEAVESHIEWVVGDANDAAALDQALSGAHEVWHLAANPEVRTGATKPESHYQQNVALTWQVLEAMRRNKVERIVFTSTSTVYGDATERPTPESYGPLLPISIYGGCKLACEGLIASHAATFGYDALLFRFANVVGSRSTHGVSFDFVQKLRADPTRLEILGDGTQTKSYVHVADTVAGMLVANEAHTGGVEAYNIGSLDAIPVTALAKTICEVLELDPTFHFTGGTLDGAGWKGDVKNMGLAVDKLRALGWEPRFSSKDAVRDTAMWLADHL